MSSSRTNLKTAFKKTRTIGPLYTGGAVALTTDGKWLVTCVGEEVVLTDIDEGTEICRFVTDTAAVTALCVTPSGKQLALFTASMALRIYDLPTTSAPVPKPIHPIRSIARAHDAPVHICKADPTSTYLASGAADGTVKVWDIARGFVTHVLRGHGGVVSALTWSFPRTASLGLEERALRLITASVDTRVRVWDLARGAERARSGKQVKPEAILEGHVSVPRGLDVTEDGRWLVTGGRDSVVLVWDMEARVSKTSGKGKEKESGPVLVNTVTVLERVEAVGLLTEGEELAGSSSGSGQIRFYTAGEKGVVRIWDGKKGSVICTLGDEQAGASADEEEQRQILDAIYVPSISTILSIHADQNILFHSLQTGTLSRHLIGFNDEIIDASLLRSTSSPTSDSHLALATNSSLIRLYSTQTLDARLLAGHTDIVLCLATSASGSVFASGGKDRAARLWAPSSDAASWSWACVGICEGHAESVGALAFSKQNTASGGLKFLFTGSQDRTIKMWGLTSVSTTSPVADITRCKSLSTTKAHDKDINALDVSPSDSLLASGSQDKTAKVFAIEFNGAGKGGLKLLGTCKGHKRGVWSVRFARGTRMLATGGGDRTVRLWGLEDFACLKVLEGHGNSVLRVDWMGGDGPGGGSGQVVSAAADGLVKIWDVGVEECVATLDGHEDKVWALTVSKDSRTIISGAADSVVTFWEDCTEEQEAEKETARAELVLKSAFRIEQDFQNYLALHDYRRAIELALSLAHPGRLYKLFKDLSSSDESSGEFASSITGHPAVDEVLRTMAPSDLARLLRYVRTWNTRASTAGVAQRVLNAIVRLRPAAEVVAAFEAPSVFDADVDDSAGATRVKEEGGIRELVEALIPYTERHLSRMERLVQESYVVDYVLGEMDGGVGEDDDEDGIGMDVDFEPATVKV
ncbi:WD40 repeat-like protein [Artomyces pyxidatus]|uniref:WD40 repeat-like protein n=1 Tax=Artomyces pyxidatus TaxID=48021 RepID=A0ACB8TDQ2_9AGAM|nr:WD40 repeat-like protein [Artomyces pyxidatus]